MNATRQVHAGVRLLQALRQVKHSVLRKRQGGAPLTAAAVSLALVARVPMCSSRILLPSLPVQFYCRVCKCVSTRSNAKLLHEGVTVLVQDLAAVFAWGF